MRLRIVNKIMRELARGRNYRQSTLDRALSRKPAPKRIFFDTPNGVFRTQDDADFFLHAFRMLMANDSMRLIEL